MQSEACRNVLYHAIDVLLHVFMPFLLAIPNFHLFLTESL